MKLLPVIALLLPALAGAQPYVEVGLGAQTGGCIYQHPYLCSQSPLGVVAVGWQLQNNFRLQFEHISSLAMKDRGVELLSIRWRYDFDKQKQ